MKSFWRFLSGLFKVLVRGIFLLLGAIVLIGLASAVMSILDPDPVEPEDQPVHPTGLQPYSLPLTEADGTPSGVLNRLVWQDYDRVTYSGRYGLSLAEKEADTDFRETIMEGGDGIGSFFAARRTYGGLYPDNERALFWNWLYERTITRDSARLPELIAIYDSILLTDKPSRQRFAEIVVSSIQHLDYVLVHPLSCEDYVAEDEDCSQFGCKWHQEGHACRPEVRYGVQTPLEFAYNLEGDCDTRVLLIMLILRQYGYDARMAWSNFYGHAVLALPLPAPGKGFLRAEGKKYFLWETTAPDWQLGQIDAQYNNLDHWILMRRMPRIDQLL